LLLIPLTAFLVDAGFTLAGRILRGERWWTPHVGHLYQRGSRRFGHTAVTLVYMAFGSISILLSVAWPLTTWAATIPMVALTYGVGGMLWVLLRRGWRD